MTQRDIFLAGEGDAYFRRNAAGYAPSQAAASPLPLEVIRGYVRPGARVLEIGCANGLNLERLRRDPGCAGSGIDPSAAAVEAGRKEFPALDLQVATADRLPFADASFDLVWFGFCLYVVDRPLLPRVVSEADRVLKDGGFLAIVDFDPDAPVRRRYSHAAGVSSFKTDHARMFLGFPQYVLAEKRPFSHAAARWDADPGERLAVQVLAKDNSGGYAPIDPA
ncbi:class I SAM-dependent methyltransferase [Ramlibacter sp. AN1133]|uniref:class I SAM-dependent methyltransferase n=1 Tax=Ramlibacter sp. AN1133 TaxID=3133429 RepID=UPI0030C30191